MTMNMRNTLIGLTFVLLLAGTAFAQTPPVLDPVGPQVVDEGQTLTLHITSSDADLTIPVLSTSALPVNAVFVDSGNGAGSFTFSPDFTQAGPFAITFRAADAVSADTATELVTITVNNVNRAPVVADPGPQSVNENQSLTFGVSSSDPDATISTLSALNLPAFASFVDSANGAGSVTLNPNFTQSGVYNISIVATDGALADTQAVAITVNNVNRAPVVADPGPQSVDENLSLTFGVSSSDPDATIPTLSALNLPAFASFVDSANGAGSVTLNPNFTQSGVYNISIVATDGSLADTQAVAITVNNVNRAPVVADPGPQSVDENLSLTFGVSSSDPDATIPTLSALNLPAFASFVDSANGAGSVTLNPNFTQSGVYNISIVATDGSLADTQAVAITVNNVNRAPVVADPGPQSVNENQSLTFGVTSSDPDATVPTLSALNLPAFASFVDSANGAGSVTLNPNFTQSGVYNISIVATDGSLADTQAVAITVNNVNQAPALANIGSQTVAEGNTLNLHPTATDADGTIPTLSVLNLPLNATFVDSGNGAGGFSFTPDNTQSGIFNVSFVATDGTLADTLGVQITVTNSNLAPIITTPGPQVVNEGQVLTFGFTATDPDLSTPSFSVLNLPANAVLTDSANGAGSITFSPDFTQAGLFSISIVASDGTLADTGIVSVTVNNVNRAPVVADPGPQSVNENQSLTIGVSSSDPDATIPTLSALNLPVFASFVDSANGAGSVTLNPNFTQSGVYNISIVATDGSLADTQAVAITVNNVNQAPILANIGAQNVAEGNTLDLHITSTDADGTTPTLTALNVPLNATFTDSANGAGGFSFTPDNTQSGVYFVSFIASDGTLADTIVVSITVGNSNLPPAITVPGPQNVDEGLTLEFGVSATDPDATIPTLSALNLPANAVFTDSANGAGGLVFSPDFTQAGVYNVSFVATDGSLADTAVVAITVNNVNRAPVLADPGPQSVNENQSLTFGVSSSDPDATIPTLSALNLPAFAVFTDSANGSGSVTLNPDFTQSGVYNISIVATDGTLADTQAVAITVNDVNQAPVIANIGAQNVAEGSTLDLHVTSSDADGATPVLTALNVPLNATFTDSANGAGGFSFTPDNTQSGVYNVSFIASDGSLADTLVVSITVGNSNLPPAITVPGPQNVDEGLTLEFGVLATDPDATIPTLSAFNLPANAVFTDSLNGAGGLVFSPDFTQAGVYNVSFVATDGSLADTAVVAITVNNVNRAPVVADPGPQSINEGLVLAVGVSASDPDATIPTLSALNLPANAVFADSLNGAGSVTFSPDFTQAGIFVVSIIATDGTLADTVAMNITVNDVNRAPVLAAIGPKSTTEGLILTFRVSATDADGTTPTLSTGALPANAVFTDSANGAGSLRFAPDFSQAGIYNVAFVTSDGVLADTEIVAITVLNFGTNSEPIITAIPDTTAVEGGSLSLTVTVSDPDGVTPPELSVNTSLRNYTFVDNRNNTGTLTYTPGYTNAGLDTIRVFATDFGSPRMTATEVFSITTTDINQPPTWAARGPYSLSAGQTLSIVVAAKDSTDPVNANRLFLSVLDMPANATFADSTNGHGLYYFAPTQAQVGTDTVHFLVVDQGQPVMSSVLNVIITVRQQNQTPVMTAIGPKVVTEGQSLSFRISASDPDGGIPVLSAAPLPSGAVFVDSLNGAGSFRWTPSFIQAGLYAVTFKATDGQATGKETVFIQVYEAGNQRPVFDSFPAISVVEADSATQLLTATDPDGGTITLTELAGSVPTFVTITISGRTATVKAKPQFGDDGAYTFSLIASDGTLADTASFNLTVLDAGNQEAVLNPIGNKQVTELLGLVFRVTATDADQSKPILSAEPLPPGAVFLDSLNGAGSFTWTPSDIDSGTYLITFFAQDADSLAYVDSEQVTIHVRDTNRVPFIITSGARTMNEGDTLRYVVNGIDPDGTIPYLRARLDGVADTLATNMVMFDSANGTGVMTFTPSYTQGSTPGGNQSVAFYQVRFYAKDGADSSLIKDATAPVQITVNNKPRPPAMNFSLGTGPFNMLEGSNLTFTVTASDLDGGSITVLSASPLPVNATFSGTIPTRTFVFNPNFTQAGTYNITFTSTKTGGLTTNQIVTINVNDAGNQNPIFSTVLADTINCPINITSQIVVRSTDPDGNPLVLSASPVVPNAQFIDSTNGAGTYFYTPDNLDLGTTFRVTFISTDPALAADTVTTVLKATAFLRGDVDNNAKYTMNDLAYLIGYLYRQGPSPTPMEAADVDKDAGVNIGDITYLINFLYLNGPRPPQ